MSKAHLTAISRKAVSAPMRRLRDTNRLIGRMLDYGCGRGYDAAALDMEQFDPHYSPVIPVGQFDTITCNYVLNTIECLVTKRQVLRTIDSLLGCTGYAYITVRNDRKSLNGSTTIGTWQDLTVLGLPVIMKTPEFVTYIMQKGESDCDVRQEF